MFSRDDLGKGTQHPLFWVLAPLVAGALLITGFGVLARSTQGFPNIELADELRLAAGGETLIADVTDFAWDRVCVFPTSATRESVNARLGFRWGVIGGDPSRDGRPLLVFVRDDEVATHLFLDPGLIDPPEGDGDCRAPDEESTRLRSAGASPLAATPVATSPEPEPAIEYVCIADHASFTIAEVMAAPAWDVRDDPAAAVLRAVTEQDSREQGWPPLDRWRRVADTAPEVVFLVETPDEEAPFAVVHAVPGDLGGVLRDGWAADSYGSCTPRPVAPDGASVATWFVDTSAEPIGPVSRAIPALVHEQACANAMSADGRIQPPSIAYGETEVTITISVEWLPGDRQCPGNPLTPYVIQLDEPLGDRMLRDGGEYPPGDPLDLDPYP